MSEEVFRGIWRHSIAGRWRHYAMVGAAAMAAQAVAQSPASLVSTVADEVVGADNPSYEIDLDGDGSSDFEFRYEPPVTASIGSISDPYGEGTISPPDGLALPGKILLEAVGGGMVVASASEPSGGPQGAKVYQGGNLEQFFAPADTTGSTDDFPYHFVGNGSQALDMGVIFSDGDGVFSSNQIVSEGPGASFLGVILPPADENNAWRPGFVAVNQRNGGLRIRGWAYATNPSDWIEFAVPVPETGTYGGLAALAAGAAGLRAWRRRRATKDESLEA